MSEKIVFFDVETTGLREDDRIVSLGLVEVDLEALSNGVWEIELLHEIFDPGRRSHPRAELVHGYDDWVLRHQPLFDGSAPTIATKLNQAKLVVAHNAEFDAAFVIREMAWAGVSLTVRSYFCTMIEFRMEYERGSAKLDAILRRMKMGRRPKHHSALLDAWYAMCVFFWLRGQPYPKFDAAALSPPLNMVEVPPHPGLPLPRRRRRTI